MENKDKIKTKLSISDYREITSMVKTMYEVLNETYKQFKDMLRVQYHINGNALEFVLQFTQEKIENPTEEDIQKFRSFLDQFKTRDDDYQSKEIFSDERICEIMKEIKDASVVIMTSAAEADHVAEDARNYFNEYISYLSSSKIRENRLKTIEAMKEAKKLEEDTGKNRSIDRKLKALEDSLTYSFLYERFILNKDKEVESIIHGMFDDRISAATIRKFETITKHLKFPDKMYSHFLNIEESFLPEEYHPFNNLFLYIVMRYVASTNESIPANVLNVRSIISSIANLIYHKFDTDLEEKEFIGIITDLLNYFMDKKDYFIEHNSSYKGNAENIQITKETEEARKKIIKENYAKMGITDYDENASFEELKEHYNEVVEQWKKEQIAKAKEKDLKQTDALKQIKMTEEALNSVKSGKNLIPEGKDFNFTVQTEDIPSEKENPVTISTNDSKLEPVDIAISPSTKE